jgi:hypothetical protein
MAEASDGGPGRRSSGARIALLAVIAMLLLAGGFALGRVTDDDGSQDDTSVAAGTTETGSPSDRGDDFIPIRENSNYDAEDVTAVFPPHIVSDDAIDAEPKGSPSRALLEWWQAYQFGDFPAVEKLTSPETLKAVDPDKLEQLVALQALQGIEILNSSESGDTATVNAGLLQFAPEKPGGPIPNKPSSSTPETFAMVKDGDQWLFAATEFLVLKLNSLPED